MEHIGNDNDDAIRAKKFKKLVVDLNKKNMALYEKEHNAPVPTASNDRSYHKRRKQLWIPKI